MSRRNPPGYGDNGRGLIRRGIFRGLNPVVTTAASVLVGVWLLMGAVWTHTTSRVLSVARDLVGPVLEWYYVLLVVFLLGFVLWLGLGRYRDIRLGGDDECPEFSFPSWVAMLFAAGTGVGLIFWSIAEPVLHFQGNPFTSQSGTPVSAAAGMRLTLFHWGLNGWAIFASVALALAYFGYRKGLPLTIRSTLHPFIGARIYGWPGHLVDTIAVFGTVFGIATTLGLGAAQMNTGINELTGVGVSLTRQFVLIAIVTGGEPPAPVEYRPALRDEV